jgi:hypothetical protein
MDGGVRNEKKKKEKNDASNLTESRMTGWVSWAAPNGLKGLGAGEKI